MSPAFWGCRVPGRGPPGPRPCFYPILATPEGLCGATEKYLYQDVPRNTSVLPPMKKTAVTILLLLAGALVLSSLSAAAAPLTVEDLFRPFEYLNLTEVYDHYSALIDFFIYTLIFVGLAQATLARLYEGRGGRAVAIGVGLSLATAAVIAEETYHFSLKSFGPYATTLTILALGIMTFSTLTRVGMQKTPSAGLAYIIAFFGVNTVAPEFFQWLNKTAPLLGAAALLALLLSLLGVLASLWPGPALPSRIFYPHEPPRWAHPRDARRREGAAQEVHWLKGFGRRAANNASHESRHLDRDLRHVRESIRRHGADPNQRRRILEEMERAVPEEEAIWRDIETVKRLNERLMALDEAVLHEDLRDRAGAMTPEEKTGLKKRINDALLKLDVEQRIARLEEALRARLRAVAEHVKAGAQTLAAGDSAASLTAVDRAIGEDGQLRRLARQVKVLEKVLLSLAKRGRLGKT